MGGPKIPNLKDLIAAGIDPKTGLPLKISSSDLDCALKDDIRKQIRLHLHHLVLGYDDRILRKSKEKILVDHKNRIKHDCQKDNLQIANLRVNSINKEKQTSNTSGIIGVHFDNRSLNWVARICVKLNIFTFLTTSSF